MQLDTVRPRERRISAVLARELGLIDCYDVTDIAGVRKDGARLGWLARRIDREMNALCAAEGFMISHCRRMGKEYPFWERQAVELWLQRGGLEMIRAYVSRPRRKHASAQILAFRPRQS